MTNFWRRCVSLPLSPVSSLSPHKQGRHGDVFNEDGPDRSQATATHHSNLQPLPILSSSNGPCSESQTLWCFVLQYNTAFPPKTSIILFSALTYAEMLMFFLISLSLHVGLGVVQMLFYQGSEAADNLCWQALFCDCIMNHNADISFDVPSLDPLPAQLTAEWLKTHSWLSRIRMK